MDLVLQTQFACRPLTVLHCGKIFFILCAFSDVETSFKSRLREEKCQRENW